MWRIIKAIVFLAVLAGAGLVAYAYLGPILGADFSAPQQEMRQRVTLDGQ